MKVCGWERAHAPGMNGSTLGVVFKSTGLFSPPCPRPQDEGEKPNRVWINHKLCAMGPRGRWMNLVLQQPAEVP